jgi:hypothetical protein
VNTRQTIRTGIALLFMLGALGVGAFFGVRLIVTGQREILPEPCVTLSLTELKPENVVVRVYNGGSIRGLAGQTAKTLKTAGFIVTTTANTDEAVHDTVIVGTSADAPEVRLVASFFENATVRADNRIDRTVDVLVGEANAPMTETHLTQITIPSGQACVPARANPTPTPTARPTPTPTPE